MFFQNFWNFSHSLYMGSPVKKRKFNFISLKNKYVSELSHNQVLYRMDTLTYMFGHKSQVFSEVISTYLNTYH